MKRRGLTLVEVVVAATVFALLVSLLLRAFLLSDRMVMRGQAHLQHTLSRVALQEQLRNDIWAATAFHSDASGQTATFTLPDSTRAVYTSSGGNTVRTCRGEQQAYQGTIVLSEAAGGLIAVLGYDPNEWGFAARMRNREAESP